MATPLWRRILFGAIVVAIGAIGLWIYLKYVWYAGPTIAWKRDGKDYELLAPRMLGIALLAPYFIWFIGRSLADLPWIQRVLSVMFRIAFVALLALGLSRLARTASQSKVCTVYVVDVSESVPDAALEDARQEIQKAIDAKPKDALLKVVTFARRPRLVPLADDAKTAPAMERHEPITGPGDAKSKKLGLGAATDIESALQLAYG